jgi:hypothetical protein
MEKVADFIRILVYHTDVDGSCCVCPKVEGFSVWLYVLSPQSSIYKNSCLKELQFRPQPWQRRIYLCISMVIDGLFVHGRVILYVFIYSDLYITFFEIPSADSDL